MISKTTAQFWEYHSRLPAELQRLSGKVYALWKNDPGHSSLHFKKLPGHDSLWSVRIGRQYRALARRRGDLVVWVWIGHHSDYDRLIR